MAGRLLDLQASDVEGEETVAALQNAGYGSAVLASEEVEIPRLASGWSSRENSEQGPGEMGGIVLVVHAVPAPVVGAAVVGETGPEPQSSGEGDQEDGQREEREEGS